jgi:PAS domain S-box-containing protein
MDVRAVENIAAAPASATDRRAALLSVIALVGFFLVTLPLARIALPQAPAFLPAVIGASIVALVVTALLLYLQYRIERDFKLALLFLAYAFSAATELLYLLTFPRLFGPHWLLGAGPQTASWFFVTSQAGFALFAIAQGLAARSGRPLVPRAARTVALATVAALAGLTLLFTLGHELLPRLVDEGDRFAALYIRITSPALALLLVVAIAVAGARWRTVTEVWLTAVLLARGIDIFTAGTLGTARFTLGWYAGRLVGLVAAVVVLAVFVVKYNGLMTRLAARTRTTAEALEIGEARYASLANVVPQLIFTTRSDGEVEYVNDRWTAYTGLDLDATRSAGWRAALHPDHELDARERWRHALRSGEPFAVEYRVRQVGGRYRWFLLNVVPVRAREDKTMAWIGTGTDVDAQKRLEERDAFLARAGERLGASLDVTATVAGIKTLLIPRLAERTWVALVDDDGRYVLAGLGSTIVSEELDGRRFIGAPLGPELHDAVASVVAGGDPVVLDKPDRFPDPWLRELPAGAAMIVPLLAGDTAIGALALVRSGGRAYDPDDVALVREFARRAALSLDHARLYERERTTADALQRAMLPAYLPQLPDIRFSESYSAASESQRVGGDFYDAFELPDGRVALAIGDVTGHGLAAAVIMGEIRQALRAASFESAEPSAILDRASRLLVASGRTVFVTAIFGVLDPLTGRFAYATAGHPPPLLHDGTSLRRLPGAGLPIGLRDEEGVDFALRLHAPCTLVFYTDGLLEFARDIDAAERRIESAIRALAAEEIEHLAGALMKSVLGEDVPTDDIAILTVGIDRFAQPLPGDEREWRFASADGRTGVLVRREVGALTAEWTGSDDLRYPSELAFGELVANAVRHAPGPLRVVLSTDGRGAVELTVEDSGSGFVPRARAIDPLAESGRGLNLVQALSQGLAVEPGPRGGSRVRVTFQAPAALPAPRA